MTTITNSQMDYKAFNLQSKDDFLVPEKQQDPFLLLCNSGPGNFLTSQGLRGLFVICRFCLLISKKSQIAKDTMYFYRTLTSDFRFNSRTNYIILRNGSFSNFKR